MDIEHIATEIHGRDPSVHVARGMPPLDMSGKSLSFYEFWPAWLMYAPVVILWLWLAMRHRSLTLPLIANPGISLSGLVGARKSDLLRQASENSRQWILPWIAYRVGMNDIEHQANVLERLMRRHHIDYPVVGKPDIGCRGAGVKLLRDSQALRAYLRSYPRDANLLIQKLASYEPEAGVFYVRYPDSKRGTITSLALKYSPYVVGDGQSTLRELIEADPRAGRVKHLYTERFRDQLDTIIEKDHPFRLVFSVSHCRGAVFRDGAAYITEALRQRLDYILSGFPEFHYGRLDIKFKSLESLRLGTDLEIVEINGASSESLHIWDRQTPFISALKTLLRQYKQLFDIGRLNRARGYRPPGLAELLRAWRREKTLIVQYPAND